MPNKITLITPPDIYENSNLSIMFMGITDEHQDVASQWMGNHADCPDTNFYYYQGEENPSWLFYALNRSDAIFVNLDTEHEIINIMGSYILGKSNVYYTTQNENLKALMSHINNQYVPSIDAFLEKVFDGQGN